MDFYDNYVRLCNSIGKTPSAVALEIGIEKSTVSRWSKGSSPNHATKIKVADYFNVSVETLSGKNEQKEKPTLTGEPLPQITQDLFKEIQGLSLEEQYAFRELLQTIKASRGEDK